MTPFQHNNSGQQEQTEKLHVLSCADDIMFESTLVILDGFAEQVQAHLCKYADADAARIVERL